MAAVLTEIALQLKTSLAFLLGLGGMFAIVKGLVNGLLVLPTIDTERTSIKEEARLAKKRLRWLAWGSLALFATAIALYFLSPIAAIDVELLKRPGALLTEPQQCATFALVAVALLLVAAESLSAALRYQLGVLAARQDKD